MAIKSPCIISSTTAARAVRISGWLRQICRHCGGRYTWMRQVGTFAFWRLRLPGSSNLKQSSWVMSVMNQNNPSPSSMTYYRWTVSSAVPRALRKLIFVVSVHFYVIYTQMNGFLQLEVNCLRYSLQWKRHRGKIIKVPRRWGSKLQNLASAARYFPPAPFSSEAVTKAYVLRLQKILICV